MKKVMLFFILAFLIPVLIHGLEEQECNSIHSQALHEWNQHNILIQQFQNAPYTENGLRLLNASLECCQKALGYCETILYDISKQSKSNQKKEWRIQLKQSCEHEKIQFTNEIHQLQVDIQRVQANITALVLYNLSSEKIDLAHKKDRECERKLNNIDVVVSMLEEIAQLYEEAAFLVNQALALINPYSQENDKAILNITANNYQTIANQYKKEASEWPSTAAAKKNNCREKIATLNEECKLLLEKGLKRSCCELQKQTICLLEQFLDGNILEEALVFKKELDRLKDLVAGYEKEADHNRLTNVKPPLSQEEFEAQEKERRDLFFKSDFLLNSDLFLPESVKNTSFPRIIPLDARMIQEDGTFLLYLDQFYMFLIQDEASKPELFVKVFENDAIIYVEKIPLPFKNTDSWDQYLKTDSWDQYLKNGMIFIPDTKLKSDYGLDMRLSFAADPESKFSLIISQKSIDPRYQFAFSLNQEIDLYRCQFTAPPPWQLETLKKPISEKPTEPLKVSALPSINVTHNENEKPSGWESTGFPILDQFIEEVKNDPIVLASFVQNEIALNDPYIHQENGIFYPSSIQKNPFVTFFEKQGSPWEQCQLLVYLLRNAGYQAVYAVGDYCSLPKDFAERMLLTK